MEPAVTVDMPPGSTALVGSSNDELEEQAKLAEFYKPLYIAVLKNDWKTAESFLKTHPDGLTAAVTFATKWTALAVAAMEGHSDIVEKLVALMPVESLRQPDKEGYLALHHAVIDGNLKSVTAILKKDPDLAKYCVNGKSILFYALVYSDGHEKEPNRKKPRSKKAFWLLSVLMKDELAGYPFTGGENAKLLYMYLIGSGHFDICLYLLKQYPEFPLNGEEFKAVTFFLAQSHSHFYSGSRLGFWEKIIYKLIPTHTRNTPRRWLKEEVEKIIPNSKSMFGTASLTRSRVGVISQGICWIRGIIWRILRFLVPSLKYIRYEKKKHICGVELAEYFIDQFAKKFYPNLEVINVFLYHVETVEMVKAFYQRFPDLIWFNKPLVIQQAVEYRRAQVFSLFNSMNGRNKMLFLKFAVEPNICYLAAKLSPAPQLLSVSGAAFQIQRELQWFQEVEKLMSPALRNTHESGKPSAWDEFVKEHEDLRKEAEKWMKDTSNYCMVVAALIATVAFAAAFTVPGGNNSNNGVPIYIDSNTFLVFAIFNALALFSSITSIVMFLSILTSRFALEDFLQSLPKRVILGLASLFFCMASMLVAFAAAISLVLKERWKLAYFPITLVASFPVMMFVILQLPLFIQMIESTYGNGVFEPKKLW